MQMLYNILWIFAYFSFFYSADVCLTKTNIQGIYYLLHSVHNSAIVWYTGNDIINTYTHFNTLSTFSPNMKALQLCFALHFYHIARYASKFRFDDWLHHGLMIGVALPIGGLIPSGGTLLGYSLFFTTGLPGGIDYVLLFLNRNGWLSRETEKHINTFLNVWIRSPGTASLATLILLYICQNIHSIGTFELMGATLTGLLNYWNGQYFMQQVVYNLGQQNPTLRQI